MKVARYIVEFLKRKGISHFFGYQGTMIAHFVDAISQDQEVYNHSCYNEQGAAFAACGYSKISGKVSVAYATSGPGALNLISGIADAYYDSVPVIFITGQLNTNEYTDISDLRQQGFQETNVVSITKPITKYSVKIDCVENVTREIQKAWNIACSGRKGPVLLDIPMNIQRSEMEKEIYDELIDYKTQLDDNVAEYLIKQIENSERPILLLGNGIGKKFEDRQLVNELVQKLKIPVLTSMLGRDLIESSNKYNYGYIGAAYGHRCANIIAYKKADLIISFGTSMCRRQTGGNVNKFAENAKIIRIDIDEVELKRKIHKNEKSFCTDAMKVIKDLTKFKVKKEFQEWNFICNSIRESMASFDDSCNEREPNKYIKLLSSLVPLECNIVCDVGQHQIWTAQSFEIKKKQRMIFSGGHGAMGFALPAAIGAFYASGVPSICIAGDGAFQMNIQELQWVVRENLPVCIVIFNNNTLGLIQQQQDDFFDRNHIGSSSEGGYTAPDFTKIAMAYGMQAEKIDSIQKLENIKIDFSNGPCLYEIMISGNSKAYPKTYFGQEMYNQVPYIDKNLLDMILNM